MAKLSLELQTDVAVNITSGQDFGATLAEVVKDIEATALGTKEGTSITIRAGAVAGSVTLTFTSVAANTVILVNGVPFTALSGTATVANNEFDISGSDTADAAAFAAAVEASTSTGVAGVVTATAASGVVTLTADAAGLISNGLMVESLGVVAAGTVTYVTPSGAQTVTLNGVVTHNATAGATATATATAVAASINASVNASVQPYFRALSRAGVVHVLSKRGGVVGNSFRLAASGTGATASGARLTGGTTASHEGAVATIGLTVAAPDGGTYATTINGVAVNATGSAGDATATAAAIVAAIQASTDSLVRDFVTATNTAGAITLTARRGGLQGNLITVAASGTGYTVDGGATALAGGAAPTAVVLAGGYTIQPNAASMTGGTNSTALTFTQ